jgi:hypothetical protein
MRRSGTMTVLTALFLTVWPASMVGQSQAPAIDSGPGDLGGHLSVEVPPGAAPPGTTITVEARDPSERPVELKAVPLERTFYELLPSDVRFGAPITVTRSISFQELGIDRFDPDVDGLIVGSLFTRDAGGTWSWLDDARVRLDTADAAFAVTGTTDHGGPIMAYVPGALLVATEDDAATPVGAAFRVEGQLRIDPASRAGFASVSGRTSDETIAKPGQSYDVESFDLAMGLEFQCLAPGAVSYETTFTLSGVGDIGPVRDVIHLASTDVAVTQTGEHTCE